MSHEPSRHWLRIPSDIAGINAPSPPVKWRKEYGFSDVDGSRPDVWRYLEDVDQGMNADPSGYR